MKDRTIVLIPVELKQALKVLAAKYKMTLQDLLELFLTEKLIEEQTKQKL